MLEVSVMSYLIKHINSLFTVATAQIADWVDDQCGQETFSIGLIIIGSIT